ncbi:hypothetical protein JOF56_011665 [Kibdelosporangium banguiense]|uniref:Uncharacterized protein n=1 Tax=Kibdelosporangium banguiense TaxID=1365924 RepID=A0ABS4U4Z4_9PSEU|nr:hypothetical protein [Kibdelosporangium banguiense]MBP2331280.1 hypothetical protein [Kibdelosporangium banguiense]
MTDLLGALIALQTAIAAAGTIRISHTAIDDMAWVVDHATGTIHLDPDLPTDEWYAALHEGLDALASRARASRGDPFGMEAFGPVTADGARVIPMRPRLRLIDGP